MQILSMLYVYPNRLNLSIDPLMKRESDSAIAKAQQQLGDTDFQLDWAEGEKMNMDEAFGLALKTWDEV